MRRYVSPSVASRKSLPALAIIGALVLISLGITNAQAPLPQGSLEAYVRSNSRMGTKLFREVYTADPDRNAVCAPYGIFPLFAFLRGVVDRDVRSELNQVFEWTWDLRLGEPHELMMARFVIPPPPLTESEMKRAADEGYRKEIAVLGKEQVELIYGDKESFFKKFVQRAESGREEYWLSNAFLYHHPAVADILSDWPSGRAKAPYGLEFKEIRDVEEWKAAVFDIPEAQALWDDPLAFVLTSVLHLGTTWDYNTFRRIDPKAGIFYTQSGSPVTVSMLVSEYNDYPYAKTERFEAVVLPANNADLIVIMPSAENSLSSLVEAFAQDPDLLRPRLERRIGDVELPEFHFAREYNLRPHLEDLGLAGVFQERARLFGVDGSRLLGVRQNLTLTVDRRGIFADAKTAMAGVLGGMLVTEEAFHMKVDRPFLFQIRDNVTGVLLFMGAVTDPSQH